MCLSVSKKYNVVDKEDKIIPSIADRDIRVYKVIGTNGAGIYNSLVINYKHEPWTKGFEYEELEFSKKALRYRKEVHGNALHSTTSYREAKLIVDLNLRENRKIVTMYIPKGALYYRGGMGGNMYASNRLVWY